MEDEVRFAADLFRGTADYYDRYRLPYPEVTLADMVQHAVRAKAAAQTVGAG